MAALLKLLALTMCLNTFMYLGVNYAMGDDRASNPESSWVTQDLFDLLLTNRSSFDASIDTYAQSLSNGSTNETRGYYFDMQSNFSNSPERLPGASVIQEQGGFSFLAPIRMIYSFVVTLWKIAFVPITIFTSNAIPPVVALLIGLPLTVLNLVTYVVLIRGGGAI